MAGVGHRKNITARGPITVTAVTTLTGDITVEADPITETTIIPAVTTLTGDITVKADPITATTIIPVTTTTVSMTTTRKTITTNIRKIIRTKNIRSITTMIRSSAEKASGAIEKAASTMPGLQLLTGIKGCFSSGKMSRCLDLTK
jgi:hypothetical protein